MEVAIDQDAHNDNIWVNSGEFHLLKSEDQCDKLDRSREQKILLNWMMDRKVWIIRSGGKVWIIRSGVVGESRDRLFCVPCPYDLILLLYSFLFFKISSHENLEYPILPQSYFLFF